MKNGHITLNEVERVADFVDISKLAALTTGLAGFEPPTNGRRTLGQLNAVCIKLESTGDGVIDALLSDDLELVLDESAKAILREKLKALFDSNARRIKPSFVQAKVAEPNRDFYLEKVDANLEELLARLVEYSPTGMQFLQGKEFVERIRALTYRVHKDMRVANILHGPCFPICIPQWDGEDYGETLDEKFIVAIAKSYSAQFPDRPFNNYRRGELEKKVSVVDESHRQLCELFRKGPVPGILVYPLQGYSVHAQREQMRALPDFVSLGGGFDVATANVGYPEVLLRDFHTLGQDMSALQSQSQEYSLHVKAHGGHARFAYRTHLGLAYGSYSGALFFRG